MEEQRRRGLDPELQAMAKIDRILSELSRDEKERVVNWVVHKWESADDESINSLSGA